MYKRQAFPDGIDRRLAIKPRQKTFFHVAIAAETFHGFERQYAANKFYVIEEEPSQTCRLRCLYCEKDVDEDGASHFVVADTARKTFSPGLAALARAPADKLKHLVIHRSEAEAAAAGFAPREGAKKLRTG